MNILIIRLSSLGDIVLTQSVAAVLRRKFAKVKIHYFTKSAFVPVVEAFGCIDQIYAWEDYKSYSKLRKLADLKLDLVVDLHNKFNTFLIKLLVGGKKTVTYNKQHFLRRRIVNHKTDKTISSTVDLYFSALQKAGIKAQKRNPELQPKQELSEKINKMIQPDQHNIAIFPGALHKTKQYPLAQMAKVIDSLDNNIRIFLLGSKNENELTVILQKMVTKDVLNLCGELSIAELISFLDRMDLIMSNDSGPMHIAAALQKPQIAIFGATHPKLGFAPMNERAIILSADLDCQPCSLHGSSDCTKKHFNCMKSITAEILVDNLNMLLSRISNIEK